MSEKTYDRQRRGHAMTTCPQCEGGGVILVGVGPIDTFGNQYTEETACPACDAGDTQAVWQAHFDVLSKAALSPAPVTPSDFLPPTAGDSR